MEISIEDDGSNKPENFAYRGAHQAFKDRWKQADDSMCRHSMSFHLFHTVRSEFFASYLYLVQMIPLGKKDHTPVKRLRFTTFSRPFDSMKDRARSKRSTLVVFACFG